MSYQYPLCLECQAFSYLAGAHNDRLRNRKWVSARPDTFREQEVYYEKV
jgi:hypothetical protein